MDHTELINRLNSLGFCAGDYWLIAGGAMVLYGLRPETHDIDLGCTAQLADKLENSGYHVSRTTDGRRWIHFSEDIELFEGWLFDRIEMCKNIPVISLQGLMTMKKALGREKDLHDIERIEAALRKTESSVDESL